MKKLQIVIALLLVTYLAAPKVFAQKTVGGAVMSPAKNIVQNASGSTDHTTLVNAIKAAGLTPTLSGAGPYTVFAPTNEAFSQLPAGTIDNLMKPASKASLIKLLTYHVVPGKLTSADLLTRVKEGKGKLELNTLSGGTITVMSQGTKLYLVDEKGGKSLITIADVAQSNGIIHVVNSVLKPN
ncbi:putative surface protein with fasciclin (FAS1) repeats [Mucilaginibacter oryzae]|uniref:Putative surface protein with fasciclin (FAS1) repeats n=1 Tax=Mucilaginibacter oryzae TaxID=468058 RepID=A0A316HND5_9SPHI|nr:fasciclin domain-containing protein [Mucilaginibacter oryzae]PWK76422.1 putative surface protein with fasciclin (FAS1) repeats [Mucilaginibacter oryzae]